MSQEMYDAASPAEKLEMLRALSARAQAAGVGVCYRCKKHVFLANDTEARMEGHVYSEAGVREFGISRHCEWCFDLIHRDDELWDEYADQLGDDEQPTREGFEAWKASRG